MPLPGTVVVTGGMVVVGGVVVVVGSVVVVVGGVVVVVGGVVVVVGGEFATKLAVRVTLEEMKVTVVLAAVVEATVPVSPVQLTK